MSHTLLLPPPSSPFEPRPHLNPSQCRAITHAFEFIVVLIMIGCTFFTLRTYLRSEEHKKHGNDNAFYIISGLFVLTLVMVPLTLRKVKERWVKANADAEVLNMV